MATAKDADRPIRERLETVHRAGPRNLQALRSALADPAPIVATAALLRLAGRNTPAARDALRQALEDARPAVRADAALALGRTGDDADLGRLAALRPGRGAAGRKLRFAKALLAHRHGLSIRQGQQPVAVDFGDARGRAQVSLEHRQLTASEVSATTPLLPHSFGVELSDHGAELICRREPVWIVLSEAAAEHDWIDRPIVLAVVIRPHQESDAWSPDYAVLASPGRDGSVLRAFSSSGRLQFTGSARQTEASIAVEITSTADATGPETQLTGSIDSGGFTVSSAAQRGGAVGGRAPTPAED